MAVKPVLYSPKHPVQFPVETVTVYLVLPWLLRPTQVKHSPLHSSRTQKSCWSSVRHTTQTWEPTTVTTAWGDRPDPSSGRVLGWFGGAWAWQEHGAALCCPQIHSSQCSRQSCSAAACKRVREIKAAASYRAQGSPRHANRGTSDFLKMRKEAV